MVNANAVYAVDNVNDTDDADTVAVEDDDKKLFGDSDDDVDDLVGDDGAATGADKRLSVDAAGDASTGLPRKTFINWEAFQTAFDRYQAEHLVLYRIRSSETRPTHNRNVLQQVLGSTTLERTRAPMDTAVQVSENLVSYPTIIDDDFMNFRVAQSYREHVCIDSYDYNFVIPKALVIKSSAVIEEEKKKRKKSNYFNRVADSGQEGNTSVEIIMHFLGGTPHFMSGAVYKMDEFYSITNKLSAWEADVSWLKSTK
ncbi:hypothetical protein PInf_025340 [Phytophthora infestans]|nr:hypothetical protein PInf_025340 [Phytophthora infestans]